MAELDNFCALDPDEITLEEAKVYSSRESQSSNQDAAAKGKKRKIPLWAQFLLLVLFLLLLYMVYRWFINRRSFPSRAPAPIQRPPPVAVPTPLPPANQPAPNSMPMPPPPSPSFAEPSVPPNQGKPIDMSGGTPINLDDTEAPRPSKGEKPFVQIRYYRSGSDQQTSLFDAIWVKLMMSLQQYPEIDMRTMSCDTSAGAPHCLTRRSKIPCLTIMPLHQPSLEEMIEIKPGDSEQTHLLIQRLQSCIDRFKSNHIQIEPPSVSLHQPELLHRRADNH